LLKRSNGALVAILAKHCNFCHALFASDEKNSSASAQPKACATATPSCTVEGYRCALPKATKAQELKHREALSALGGVIAP
jgi:hypothetical protein